MTLGLDIRARPLAPFPEYPWVIVGFKTLAEAQQALRRIEAVGPFTPEASPKEGA